MLKIKLPIIKLVVYNKLLALFSEQMRILVMSGIPIDHALGIVADLMGNEVFKKAALKLKESVSAGNSIADSMKPLKEFPQLVIRMVGIGETSGNLDEQFGFLSDYYLKKLDDYIGEAWEDCGARLSSVLSAPCLLFIVDRAYASYI